MPVVYLMANPMDARVRKRYLQKGLISRSEIEKYIKELPDLSEQTAFIDYDAIFESLSNEDAPEKDSHPLTTHPQH